MTEIERLAPRPAASVAHRPTARHRVRIGLVAALLLATYFVLAWTGSLSQSPTFDESVHITSGYNAWINHDLRFDPGNGDFVKRWATLPLLISRPTFPPQQGDDWTHGEFFRVAHAFMFEVGNDPDAILCQTRAMVALLGVGLGWLVFSVSRRLFGNAGALVSLAAFAFAPEMLAHGAIVSTDLALSLALFASTWSAWRLLHVVSWPNLIGSVVAFSILVISKMSAVLIVPVVGVLVVVRCFNRAPWIVRLSPRAGREVHAIARRSRQAGWFAGLAALHAIVAWGAIWATFDFKYLARARPEDADLTLLRTPGAHVDGAINDLATFCHTHHLLPEGFLKGMEELVGISKRRPSFLDGHWKAGGHALFFPYAFWAKTSPALLALVALGLAGVAVAWRRRPRRSTGSTGSASAFAAEPFAAGATDSGEPALPTNRPAATLYEVAPLAVLFIGYAAVAMRQDVNIGHRHILALYPVLYVLAGAVALLPRRWWSMAAVGLLLGAHVVDSMAVRPHYLAYFSPAVGGPVRAYERLVDSSLDWGQDLPGLERWLAAHNPDGRVPVYFSYFGTGSPGHYGVVSQRLPSFPEWRTFPVYALTPGYYAISATMFQQVYATTFGPWNRLYEDEYQVRARRLGLTEENTGDTAALGRQLLRLRDEVWQQNYGRYEQLRFGRLCAWLRATGRKPDAEVGYSILVWKLDDRDLRDALWGKPRELYQSPASSLPDGI